MKKEQKTEALKLRKQGYSLTEISSQLHIAKSTASLWLRSVELSTQAAMRIKQRRDMGRDRAAHARKISTDRKLIAAIQNGKTSLRKIHFSKEYNQLLCALLYWCEGTKLRRGGTLTFTNSDPELVHIFLNLLRHSFDIDECKLRLVVHLHTYHKERDQLRFWSKVTNIPLTQCNRPYRKAHTGIRTREGYQGCVSVRYHDVVLGRKIEGIAKAFLNKRGP